MTSEADTRANFIDPALVSAGWNSQQIIRKYYFTVGRKFADNRCLMHPSKDAFAYIWNGLA